MSGGKIMKRVLVVPAVLVLATLAVAESRLFLSAGAGFLRPGDAAYRSVYGNQAVFPEFAASFRVVAGLCLSGSVGQFQRSGVSPELRLETRARQSYVSYGLSYLLRVSPIVCLQAGAGMASLSFREEAFGTEIRGRHSGFEARAGVFLVPEDERVFMGFTAGYVSARVPGSDFDPALSRALRLGGLKFAVSVGIQLFGGD